MKVVKITEDNTTMKPLNQNRMELVKIQNHIMHCLYELQICERKSNNLNGYYFRKQIEVAKRKLKTFKSE
jgi:hypothetical protein